MTTVVSTGFEDLEIRTFQALSRTAVARRALRNSQLYVKAFVHGQLVSSVLRQLVKLLKTVNMDAAPQEDLAALTAHLRVLHCQLDLLVAAASRKGLMQGLLGPSFRSIKTDTEEIGDILESLDIALNPGFCALIDRAAGELKPSPGRPDWRASLARMRD